MVASQDGPAAAPCRGKKRHRENVFFGKGRLEEELTPTARLSDLGRQRMGSNLLNISFKKNIHIDGEIILKIV